jgi:hypothetical protein
LADALRFLESAADKGNRNADSIKMFKVKIGNLLQFFLHIYRAAN